MSLPINEPLLNYGSRGLSILPHFIGQRRRVKYLQVTPKATSGKAQVDFLNTQYSSTKYSSFQQTATLDLGR
jgi:hypothetical protein